MKGKKEPSAKAKSRPGALGRALLAGLLAFSLSPAQAFADDDASGQEAGVPIGEKKVEPVIAPDIADPWSTGDEAPDTGEESVALSPDADADPEGGAGPAVGLLEEVELQEIQTPVKNLSAPDFSIKGLDGKTTSFNSDYKNKARMIVVGRSTCWNTSSVSASMAKLLSQEKYAGLQGAVLCIESKDEASFKTKYGKNGSANVVYGSDGDAYGNLGWDLYRKAGYSSTSVTLPFVFFVDKSNAIRYVSTGYLSEQDIASKLNELAGIAADPSEKTVSLKIAGTDRQAQGRALLPSVNAARKQAGKALLAWNEALEKTAQQRAAELAVYYSHTRPGGSECYTAFPAGVRSVGENIAIGYSDATEVNEAWANSEGHYANMVNASFSSMGSACFTAVCSDGGSVNCWVEVFSGASGSGVVTETEDKKVVKEIVSLQQNLSLSLEGPGSLEVGEAGAFKLCNANQKWPYATQVIEPASATWSSSNVAVVSVDATGTASAKKAGSATVTAALGDLTTSKTILVDDVPAPAPDAPAPPPDKPTTPSKPSTPSEPSKPSNPSTPSETPTLTTAQASRLAGDTALDTMAAVTRHGFASGSCSTVVVATMGGYWDALSASALAGLKGCPILLTDGSSLSAQTASEIKRLGASKVYIAGGASAVSAKVESSLKSLSCVKTVKRLAGDVAVNTALEIYKEGKGSWGTTAVVATSYTFQDALSVSPYAFAKKAPIFLANASSGKLDPQVLSAVKKGGFKRVVIVGGTAAISDQVEKFQLKGITCKRLSGPTAYETSGAIAAWCLTQGMTAANVGIATGASYYDALAGAALCGKNNSALVLVDDANRSNIEGFLAANKGSVGRAYIFGGSAAVSEGTRNEIVSALK